jgi:hypothetical protein
MSDDFEDHLKRWMRARAGTDRSGLQALAGNVAALPPRRNRLRSNLAAAAAVVLAVGLSAVLLAPRIGTGDQPASPRAASSDPGLADPAAFPAPERLSPCGGLTAEVQYAFEIASASDLPRHFPSMTQSIEQLVDVPAIVVVYRGYNAYGVGGSPGSLFTRPPLEPNEHDICLILPEPGVRLSARLAPIYYDAVDITGFRVRLDDARATPPPTDASRTDDASAAPSWAFDLLGQLECEGSPQDVGGELGEFSPVGSTGTASPWPWLYDEDVVDLPLEGWTEAPKVPWETGESDLMRYVNVVDGRIKAVLVMGGHSTDGGRGRWAIVAFRACHPNEFDPLRGRTTDDAPWTNAAGDRGTSVRTIVGPAHCGWESTVWLYLDDASRLYLRDPLGVFRDVSVGDYRADTELPADARSTGYRSRDRELFTTADKDFVYVRTPAGVERWPRSTDPLIGCA